MLFLMKSLFGFCLDLLLPKNLDNTGEQFGNYQQKLWQHCIRTVVTRIQNLDFWYVYVYQK